MQDRIALAMDAALAEAAKPEAYRKIRLSSNTLDASAPLLTGVHVVKVKTAQGMFVRQVSLM